MCWATISMWEHTEIETCPTATAVVGDSHARWARLPWHSAGLARQSGDVAGDEDGVLRHSAASRGRFAPTAMAVARAAQRKTEDWRVMCRHIAWQSERLPRDSPGLTRHLPGTHAALARTDGRPGPTHAGFAGTGAAMAGNHARLAPAGARLFGNHNPFGRTRSRVSRGSVRRPGTGADRSRRYANVKQHTSVHSESAWPLSSSRVSCP